MIVKKFEGPTEAEAVLKAKEDLGPQAVVLNVKSIKQRGIMRLFRKDFVEITAALEEKDFAQEINQKKPVMNTPRPHIDVAISDKQDAMPVPEDIERKIDSISEILIHQMKDTTPPKVERRRESAPVRNQEKIIEPEVIKEDDEEENRKNSLNNNMKTLRLIYNKLIDNEVDEKYANAIINEIEGSLKKESNVDSILAGVYQKIILKIGEPEPIKLSDKQKVVYFMGPTGVGKTTTIAKIASKFSLHEHKKVALITSDTYRIAAVEQLNTYANILKVPIKVVYTEEEIKNALEEFKDYDLILIDTAGRSHKNVEQKEAVIDLYQSIAKQELDIDSEVYLVLSVTTKYRDLISITKAYEHVGDYKLLFTKLDETSTLGNILNIRMLTGACLSYTTTGQNVPDDIETINVQKLAKQLLGGNV